MFVSGQNFITDLRSNETKPSETYKTSIGFDYLMADYWKLNAEIFGTTGKNHLQTDNITLIYYGEPSTDNPVFKSSGTTQTVGLDLDLQYNTNYIDARFNYSYSHAKGTSSYTISNYPFTWYLYARDSITYKPINHELEYNSQHSGMAFISYKTDENASKLLQNITLSMLCRFDSGHSYTLLEAGWW